MRTCEIFAQVKRDSESDNAILIDDGSGPVWVPRSLIDEDKRETKDGKEFTNLTIPEWFALRKGLI